MPRPVVPYGLEPCSLGELKEALGRRALAPGTRVEPALALRDRHEQEWVNDAPAVAVSGCAALEDMADPACRLPRSRFAGWHIKQQREDGNDREAKRDGPGEEG